MSGTQTTQVKITLSNELYLHLKSKAEKLGLNMASYVKHLVINDVKDIDIPVLKMSNEQEKVALKSLNLYRAGKTKVLKDIEKYLSEI